MSSRVQVVLFVLAGVALVWRVVRLGRLAERHLTLPHGWDD